MYGATQCVDVMYLVIVLEVEMAVPYFCGPVTLLNLYRRCRIFSITHS